MTTFDKREEGFEKKFVIDEELKFKAAARRNRLLGLWVAEQLGIRGDAASAYAKQIVTADFDGYFNTQRQIEGLRRSPSEWGRKSILNIANMAWFSSDRTIGEYAADIWNVPVTPAKPL